MNNLSRACPWCETSFEDGLEYDELATLEFMGIATITDTICEKCENVLVKEMKITLIEEELGKLGMKFEGLLDTLEAYEAVLRQGVIAERVRMYEGEESMYDEAFKAYQAVCSIINS